MKLKLFLLALCMATYAGINAQGLSKSEVLNVLTDVNDLNLDSQQEEALETASNKAVDNLFEIADGGFSPDEMSSKFKMARDENQKAFKNILGEDNFKKYQKKVKKQLRPLKRKAKLVGFLI